MANHRRKKTDDPQDKTEVMCVSVSSLTKARMKEQADKLNISVSHLADQVFSAYLRTRKALTSA